MFCWPRPQQRLPVSAAGGGRRRCMASHHPAGAVGTDARKMHLTQRPSLLRRQPLKDGTFGKTGKLPASCRKRIYPFRLFPGRCILPAERMNAFPTIRRKTLPHCQRLSLWESCHEVTERARPLPLYNRYKSQENCPHYPCKSGRTGFSTWKKPNDCASCTENALFDKTEKIKKKIRSFF